MRRREERNLFRDGPIGTDNYRKQLGRSFNLGLPVEKLKETLVYTGATQRTRAGANGMAGRAPGDAVASLYQITCSYRGNNDANDDRPLVVRGQIDWGVDGHQCTAFFDWLNGAIVQVAASFVRVSAQVVPQYGGDDEAPSFSEDAICVVGATIGYGAAIVAPATYTQQIRLEQTAPPALPTVALDIPRFARRLWWLGPVPSSAQWANGPSSAQALGEVDPLGLNTRQAYERPGGASQLLIAGNAGLPTLNSLVWELSL